MFVYIPDWYMYYVVDAFRYDVERQEAVLSICNFRMEIVIRNISKGKFRVIRHSILHEFYLEISREYEWTLRLI